MYGYAEVRGIGFISRVAEVHREEWCIILPATEGVVCLHTSIKAMVQEVKEVPTGIHRRYFSNCRETKIRETKGSIPQGFLVDHHGCRKQSFIHWNLDKRG